MNIPNILSILRIVLVIPLILTALLYEKTLFSIIFIIGGLTDVLDGCLARKLKKATPFGSKLDSIADYIFYPIGLTSLFFLTPEIILENKIVLIITGLLALILIIIKLISKKFITPHHYISKVSTVSIYTLIVYTLLFGYNQVITIILISIVIFGIIKNYQLLLNKF